MEPNHPYRYWFIIENDTDKPIGGVKQIHVFAALLKELNIFSRVVHNSAEFRPTWFKSSAIIVGKEAARQSIVDKERDVIIFPETFVSFAASRWPGFKKILFNQNSHYSFGLKREFIPESVLQVYKDNFCHYLCVSRYDQYFLETILGLGPNRVSRLVNSVDDSIFHMNLSKIRQIVYMPRKNKSDSRIVCSLLSSQSWFSSWTIKPIHNLPQHDVASLLGESLVYLSFGHPEGFGLPLIEASACGCAIIGYTGNGGAEIFTDFHSSLTSSVISYNDWAGFVDSTRKFADYYSSNPLDVVTSLASVSSSVISAYSYSNMMSSVLAAIEAWMPNLSALPS